MKYYNLSLDQDYIGKYSQVDTHGLDTEAYIQEINRAGLRDINGLMEFDLEQGANFTDILSHGGIFFSTGLLISESFKDFLSQFNLFDHKFYSGKLNLNDSVENIYWLKFDTSDDNLEMIDFKRSTFYKEKFMDDLGEITIDNALDFNRKIKEINEIDDMIVICPKKIVLKELFLEKGYDMIALPRIITDVLVSQTIKNAMEKESFKGILCEENIIVTE
ncbi:hypothetical protein [Hyunsoonleella pacifica]|uniref:Uncharacterized protein n=1 Tax=Hyunsoonleella pacifica TaxID=1080224 RepID=A0A4Q9FR88_9FLAO|nr:hypothetical protein [Hyunsoonleella pacifica]TBN17884.1 hypothetical protein EYD46_06125 [Hyunsoonleella pacifica]GGD08082.1 hypothetical protein GCM10011368_07570 [Hyunsoonleella pacifica]